MSEAQSQAIIDRQSIDAIFAQINGSDAPGGVVAIAVDGVTRYRRGFGLACLDAPIVLTPSTRLRIGSVTKQFSSLAFMLLCEDGLAHLDQPIGDILPGLTPANGRVTPRQLMAHMSGVRDAYTIFGQFEDNHADPAGPAQRVLSDDILQYYRSIEDHEAPPGDGWRYNNGGYLLLSAVIEALTGQSLETVLKDRIFDPIGLADTLLLRSDTSFIGNRGSQHVVNPAGGYERLHWGMDNFLGAGAMISTADDLLRWLIHMDRPVIGNSETWALMTTSGSLPSGMKTNHGFGLELGRYRGRRTISHAGGAFGGGAYVLKLPDAKLDIVVLSNRQDVSSTTLAYRVVDAIFGQANETAATESAGKGVTGVYRDDNSGHILSLSETEERQFVAFDGGIPLPLARDRDDSLYFPSRDAPSYSLRFEGRADEPAVIELQSLIGSGRFHRLPPPAADAEISLAGVFEAAAIGVRLEIAETGGRPDICATGRFGSGRYGAEAIAPGVWLARRSDPSRGVGIPTALLSLGDDRSTLRFSSGPLFGLAFKRVG